MADALQKARADGIPVVLVNRPLSASGSSVDAMTTTDSTAKEATASTNVASPGAQGAPKSGSARPFVLVAPPSFTESARQLVSSAIRNAKNAQKLDPNGGSSDRSQYRRRLPSAVIERWPFAPPLKDNRIIAVEEITFSKSADVGAKLLKEKLHANSKLVLVFAIDGLSTSALRSVMAELIPDRLFVQSAFAAEGNYADMTRAADFAAVAGFIPNRVLRKAIIAAVSLSQGRDVPTRIEVPVELHDSDEKSSTPQSPIYYKSKSPPKKGS